MVASRHRRRSAAEPTRPEACLRGDQGRSRHSCATTGTYSHALAALGVLFSHHSPAEGDFETRLGGSAVGGAAGLVSPTPQPRDGTTRLMAWGLHILTGA